MVRSEVRKPVPGCLSHNHWLVREDRRRSSNPCFLLESFLGTPRSHRSLKGNDLHLSLLASLPVLPSHQHEIVRLLSGALGILGKQKTELNSLAMNMCKEVGTFFRMQSNIFSRGNHFIFSCPFPSMACLQPQLIGSQTLSGGSERVYLNTDYSITSFYMLGR